MTVFDVSKVEQYRENNRIEAKKALGGLPRSIWETYSAFANAQGGVILLGVEEYRDKSLHVVDLPDPEELIRQFWRLVNDPKKASVNLLSPNQVEVETVDGKQIIEITVPRAGRYDRPVYVDGDPVLGTYRRSGEGDYRCPEEEVRRMQAAAACYEAHSAAVADYLDAHGAVSAPVVSALVGITASDARALLEKMAREGRITAAGSGKKRVYR